MGTKQYDGVAIAYTAEEQAARDASAVKAAQDQAKEDAQAALEATLSAIYAPVEYNGKLYPADEGSMAKYEMAKQSRGRGKAKKGIAVALDGSVLKLSSAAAIDAFHGAIEDVVIARLTAVHDAL